MKYFSFIIIITLFLSYSGINAQSEKYSESLIQSMDLNTKSEYTLWIYFKDKGSDISAKLLIAENLLSDKSIKRREKLIKNGPVVDYYDIPAEDAYIQQVIPYLNTFRHQSRWLNAISAEVSVENLDQIADLDFVKKIDIVRKGTYNKNKQTTADLSSFNTFNSIKYDLNYGPSLTQLEQINVPVVHDLGYNGVGITICVLDAGFNNLEHQVFSSLNIIDQWDFVNNDSNVDDEGDMGSGNHGTMTLSSIGGFHEGQLIGPAYGASYILAKTENTDSETQVEEDNWVAGAEWADFLGADITSTSLSYTDFDDGSYYSPAELDGNTAVITIAGDIAAGKGILVVNSAGNYGDGVTTIGAPADGDSVLAIGAVNASGTRVSFSSVGPTGDGRIKPEVMAMGSGVVVAETFGNNYTTASGTSFSCPLTAGAAALLWEMVPDASNMDIFEALKMTANNAGNPNNQYGWGIIDIYAAYDYLTQLNTFSVTFVVSDGSNPIENANIDFVSENKSTDASGQAVFTNITPADDIDYTVSKSGYDDFNGILSVVDENVTENVTLIPTDIENISENNNIRIIPNPSNDFIKIEAEGEHKINEIIIYNISGQVQKNIQKVNMNQIDISNLKTGIYFCKVICQDRTSSIRFVKSE